MHILFLSTWYPFPPDNGSKLRAHYLLRSLAEHHDVTCVAFDPEGNHAGGAALPAWATALKVHALREDPYQRVHASRLVRYLSPIPLAYAENQVMRDKVESLGDAWDAVVAVQMPVARYLPGGARAAVIDVDTSLSFQMAERLHLAGSLPGRVQAWVSYQKARLYEAQHVRRFDLALVAGAHELPHTRRIAGLQARVEVLPNGVDCEHNVPGLTQAQDGHLVYNGALTYSANYDAMRWFLAEVYPRIRQAVPSVSLTITGSTKGIDLTGLALDDSVHLTGFVPDVRLPVAGASVCVVPIRQGGGTRLKILEAMALGTPVVATTKGAEGLNVQAGVHLVIADDPSDFAAQTVRLLGNEAERQRLAVNARSLVEHEYDWLQIGARFVALVEDAVMRRRETSNPGA